jgi:hypothetical protein
MEVSGSSNGTHVRTDAYLFGHEVTFQRHSCPLSGKHSIPQQA